MFINPWKENRLLKQLLAAKDETIRTLEAAKPIDPAVVAETIMGQLERLCRDLKGEGPAMDFRIGEERGLRRRVLHRLLENLDNPAKMRSIVEKELALSKERQQALEVVDGIAVRQHLYKHFRHLNETIDRKLRPFVVH